MTDTEKLLQYARQYTNDDELIEEDIPLFIDEGLKVLGSNKGIKSKSLGDASITYQDNPLKTLAKEYLQHFRKLPFPS